MAPGLPSSSTSCGDGDRPAALAPFRTADEWRHISDGPKEPDMTGFVVIRLTCRPSLGFCSWTRAKCERPFHRNSDPASGRGGSPKRFLRRVFTGLVSFPVPGLSWYQHCSWMRREPWDHQKDAGENPPALVSKWL